MIEIDGSAGGGQLLRTALSLAAVSHRPVRITGIRGGREPIGLRAQHCAVVDLMAQLCGAEVSDYEIGTADLTFEPGSPVAGTFEVDIGTAGSATLLCDAVLPLATVLEEVLTVRIHGGTDVKWAPTSGYYRAVKLPLLRRLGLFATLEVERYGFYPTGGGTAKFRVVPGAPPTIDLTRRGELDRARVLAVSTHDLSDARVGERMVDHVTASLTDELGEIDRATVSRVAAESTGAALVTSLAGPEAILGFDRLGEPGVKAETVAEEVVANIETVLGTDGVVDPHAADQLMPILALVGGTIHSPWVTDHVQTQADVIAAFGVDVSISDRAAYAGISVSEPLAATGRG